MSSESTATIKEVKLGYDQPQTLPFSIIHIFSIPGPPQGTATLEELKLPPEFTKYLANHEQDVLKTFFEETRKGKTYPLIAGAFGDMVDCDGIIEEKILPKEGGCFVKIWGCPYLFKGYPRKEAVEGLGLAKTMLSQFPRKIISKSWFWRISLAFRFVFSKKTFFHDLHIVFLTIHGHTLRKLGIPASEYNAMTSELRRAGNEVLKKMLDKNMDKNDFPPSQVYFPWLLHYTSDVMTKREFWELLACLLDFCYFFIESDNAYRFRLQDISVLLDKEEVKKDVIKVVKKLFNALIERENPVCGIAYKWRELRKIVIPLLYLSKELREFIKEYLLEINVDKVKMDEADHYFSLRRHTYRFGGISTEERLKEAIKIDKEKKITRFEFTTVTLPNSTQPLPAVRIVAPINNHAES